MKRIIIVDDDQAVLNLMQDALASEDYHIQTCTNGTELQALLSEPPNLIVLDVFLKGEDGRELCRRLKNTEETKAIPIILYSAHLRAREALPESQADDFLGKPFRLADLLAKVERYLVPVAS